MIVVRLIGFLFDLILLPLRLLRHGRSVRPGSWLSVTVDGPVVDVAPKPRFWEVRTQRALSLHWLDEVVTSMIADPRIRGMLLTIRTMSGGMASATSLRSILARARAAGKEVAVHLPMGGDTKEVYVATAANKILIGPTTQLAPLGFRTASRYLKHTLDRAGIEPQVFACGEFKSAGETLVRDSMSSEQRAQLERLLEIFHTTLLDGIASGRGTTPSRAAEIVDQGPYFGRAAIDAGLADELAYEDEVVAKLVVPVRDGPERTEPKGKAKPGRRVLVDAGAYLARRKRPLLRRLFRRPVVAVIPVHGAIGHVGGTLGGLSTDERVARMVRQARRDRRVRGVILHIDSPGGSALASDLMHHEIVQLAREKPVVACMANVAASGGYYVAAPAACIVAEPTTVTGSIGVVAARLSLEPLLERLGIRTEVIEKGARASLLSPMGRLDDDDRTALMRELSAMYQAFVGVVASGRELPEDEVERLARGRVYTGKDALDVGLVDTLGGFAVAVEEIRRRLSAADSDRVAIVVARPPRGRVPSPDRDSPPDGEPARQAVKALLAALLPARERVLLDLVTSGERILAIGPIMET
jgi:protease IV